MVKTLVCADFTHDMAVTFQTYFAANRCQKAERNTTLSSGCQFPVAQRPAPGGGMQKC